MALAKQKKINRQKPNRMPRDVKASGISVHLPGHFGANSFWVFSAIVCHEGQIARYWLAVGRLAGRGFGNLALPSLAVCPGRVAGWGGPG